ncbi:MAG: methionyl-tRNA formyltransferase [Thermodesulfovibrionales bacterium]
MALVFFGTPDFAVPSLRALVESGEEVLAAVCQPDKPKGRGHQLSEPPVKVYARKHDIRVLQPKSVRTEEFVKEIALLAPEAIVVVAYGRILPPAILSVPRIGCVNVHASLLPRYRGAAPIQWAVIQGETKTGVTTMLMDEGLDTGDVLLVEETSINGDDTAQTLAARLSEMGAGLLVRTLRGLRAGTVKPVPQAGEPSYAPILRKEDGQIDWTRKASEIANLVRGTHPWPGAFCFFSGERLTVLRAYPEEAGVFARAGTIVQITNDEVRVAAGFGTLVLTEVKPDGKKAMSAAAFFRGKRAAEGALFDV